jgi:predicted ATPase
MRIKEISLKNFKRFTDLTIKDIPESAKLVLLIGANGSGKSSVFDAFGVANTLPWNKKFYLKNEDERFEMKFTFSNGASIVSEEFGKRQMNKFSNVDFSKLFYGRSSIRIIPQISKAGIEGVVEGNLDKPDTFIQPDLRFNEDVTAYLKSINEPLRDRLFKGKGVDNSEILKEFISPLNSSLANILGVDSKKVIQLTGLKDAGVNEPPNLVFRKGDSEITYDLLSHGEKQVVILLLNFIVRNKYYQDTIYFIDEMDTHIETSIQKRLIEDVVKNWIPNGSQLWTASHALGFIEYANKSDDAVIIDFDNLDFDVPQALVPAPKDNAEVYEIAVGKEFLSSLFSGFDVYFVENKDKQKYALAELDRKIFVPENGRNGVYHKVKSGQYLGIVDRDYLNDDDIAEIRKQYKNLWVLEYYCIENYLFHPDNLEEYNNSKGKPFDKAAYIKHILDLKNTQIKSIMLSLSLTRTSYPYFGEPAFNESPNQNRFKNKGENIAQSEVISEMLSSDDFNIFYKVFSMKKAGLEELANIHSDDLAKTTWFKTQIQQLLS